MRLSPSLVPAMTLVVGATGCGSDNRLQIEVPHLSPGSVAQQAMAEFDANKDGFLDAKELDKCPSLKAALKKIDTDGDGKLSAGEITSRVTAMEAAKLGMVGYSCQIQLNGEPLAGATVTFVPEKFMGSACMPAKGTTGRDGRVSPKSEGSPVPGLFCGYYRLVVSKADGGKEIIPAKYNAQTELGMEVSPDTYGRGSESVFKLGGK